MQGSVSGEHIVGRSEGDEDPADPGFHELASLQLVRLMGILVVQVGNGNIILCTIVTLVTSSLPQEYLTPRWVSGNRQLR